MHVAGEILLELFCCMPGLLDGAEFGKLSDVWSVSQNFCAQVEPHYQSLTPAKGERF